MIFLIIATIPGAIGGYLLQEQAASTFRSPQLIGVTLIVMGIVLWLVDKLVDQRRVLGEMRWIDSLLIGLSQVVALIPGVSRSGATMTTSRGLRFDRESAAEFSFLMSMPIIVAAIVVEGPKALAEGGLTNEIMVGSGRIGRQRVARDLDSHAVREQAQLRDLRFLSGRARNCGTGVLYARG